MLRKNREQLEKQLDRLAIERFSDGRLDWISRELVRASWMSDQELEMIASSPSLYARIRARIRREQDRRSQPDFWLVALRNAWRPVAGMGAAAIIAAALFQFTAASGQASPAPMNEEYALTANPGRSGIDRVLFMGGNNLTSDEVLSTIISQDANGTPK
jgi:hypothetical protein